MLDASSGVDEFVHGLIGFLVELSQGHPNHPMLAAFGEELGRAASAPMTASAMHDLRSILQGVTAGLDYAPGLLERSGLLAAAKSKQAKVDERRVELLLEAIDDARSGAKLAAELASETLQIHRDCMSSADPKLGSFAPPPIRLNEVVGAAARLAGRSVEVELRLETDDGLEVRAPRSAIMRVLINLLRNAAHAIDELEDPIGAGVVVSTWSSDEFAFVQVADEGPGIPTATLESIFELFFTTHAEGTGVGLYVCKTLVTGWGGMIHVDSSDGEGASFTFSVPLSVRPA
ncbi:MAG: HAMP domain-containing sensor histidine kinase [Enhygromyxa sp.]